jgi:hypothetical protein
MKVCIFDIETNGLLGFVTKLHCFHYVIYVNNVLVEEKTLFTKEEIEELFKKLVAKDVILVGHKILTYDLPALKELLGISFTGKVWDTLVMSWDLYPERKKHGLEDWGEEFKVQKPHIDFWDGLDIQVYIDRCKTDVIINSILFGEMWSYYQDIYYPESPQKRLDYIHFKMDCAIEQQNNPLTIDVNKVKETHRILNDQIEKRKAELKSFMPDVPVYGKKTKPKKFLNKDNSLSKEAQKWLELLEEEGYSLDTEVEEIKYIKEYKSPNPNSIPQIKNWLFSLGWIPTIYKTTLLKSGEFNKVPQLQDADRNLCPNIYLLCQTHESLYLLEGLFMLIHRQGVMEAFLENLVEDNKIVAEIAGFTNTMRFKHKKPICNLPGIDRPYGKEIRGSIIPNDKHSLFCGSDMSSLEDTTKQHYMYFYDPEYVKVMRVPGFDPHLDIALLAGLLNEQQVQDHKDKKVDYKKERKLGKVVNFSGIYGAGPPKIATTSGLSLELATILHTTYWSRNKAVKQIAKDAVYKSVRGQLWLWNPIAKMWYYLKNTKDIFSCLNQGSGVYCFDVWVREVRKRGIVIQLQYHDEIGFSFLKTDREKVKQILQEAIKITNEKLKLNVPLGISIDIGDNYAESH